VYTLTADAWTFWTGEKITLTIRNSEGWAYVVKADMNEALCALYDSFPELAQLMQEARMDREREHRSTLSDPEIVEPDTSSGQATRTRGFSEEEYQRIMDLRARNLSGLHFPLRG
jgi:hypothetical protein